MSSVTKKLSAALLLGGIVVIVVVPELQGQARVLPNTASQLPTSTQIGAAKANVSQITQGGTNPVLRGGFNANPGHYGGAYPNPGYAYNPYGTNMTPAYGYLSGASQVIGAQGQYLLDYQQSEQMNEQVKQERFTTRRKQLEEWRYEQEIMPTAEEIRAKQEKADLDRMRNNPPSIDIWTGDALNTLLRDIQKMQSVGMGGPSVMLDPATLQKITVTDGRTFGQGLLKDGGKLTWPYAMEYDFFDSGRKRMDKDLAEAVGSLQGGKRPAPKVVQDMMAVEDEMRTTLKQHIHDLTPSQGVEARRYLNDLHETIRTLQDPNASNYASGKWSAQGNSVAELVAHMTRNGLKFGPAASGNETAYSALYQSMVSYDRMLASVSRH